MVRLEPEGYMEMPPPVNVEAEAAVLGSVLLNPEAYTEVMWLEPDDFYMLKHDSIWRAFQSIFDRGGGIDHLTVVDELQSMGKLGDVGGAAYIISLFNQTPSALNVESYGRIVERMALRRRVVDAGQAMARLAGIPSHIEGEFAYQGPPVMNSRELIDACYRELDQLVPVSDRPTVSMESAISTVYDERVEDIRRKNGDEFRVPDMPTGFTSIDMMTDYAFAPGVLAVIMALPKMGKTTIALQITLTAAAAGIPVVYATYEMAINRLTYRAWALHSEVSESAIRGGRALSEAQEKTLADSMSTLAALPIQYVNTPVEHLAADVAAIEERYGRKGLLVVDNVNSAGRITKEDNQQAQISESLGILDEIKLRTGFAVLGLVHQRDDYDKQASMDRLKALLRPNLFNSFGSRAAMRYGEIVMGLWRPEVISQQIAGFDDSLGEDGTPKGCARMFMLATRYGPSDGTCLLGYNASIPKFVPGNTTHHDIDDDLTQALLPLDQQAQPKTKGKPNPTAFIAGRDDASHDLNNGEN